MQIREAILEVWRPKLMVLEAILGILGDIWGALGGILGAVGVILRAILEVSGAFWWQIWE